MSNDEPVPRALTKQPEPPPLLSNNEHMEPSIESSFHNSGLTKSSGFIKVRLGAERPVPDFSCIGKSKPTSRTFSRAPPSQKLEHFNARFNVPSRRHSTLETIVDEESAPDAMVSTSLGLLQPMRPLVFPNQEEMNNMIQAEMTRTADVANMALNV